jgi:hypothetical protein
MQRSAVQYYVGQARLVLHAIAFIALLVVLWTSRKRAGKTVLRRSIATGFVLYFIFWILFCWSEWKPEYGFGDFLLAVFFSTVVGALGALAFGLFAAVLFWAYRKAVNTAGE